MAMCLAVSLFLVLGPVHLHQAWAADSEEQRLLELINEYRQENGAGPLVPSGVLATSATRHSEDMAAHNFFSHSTRESSYYPRGSGPADRAAREGYPTKAYTAENIARGQLTAEEVFRDWRGSPEYNAAMLGEQYTAVGIGHVDSYWTADFGAVADTQLDPEPLQPHAGRIDEPTTGERTATPPSAIEQTTNKQEGFEHPIDDERTPEEQARPEGPQLKVRDVATENESVAGETETIEQTSTPQQDTAGQAPDGEAPTRGETPDQQPNEETTSGTASSPQPTSDSGGTKQYATEIPLAEILSASSKELAIGDLIVGANAQEAAAEEGLYRASPLETEAMETALSTREEIPEEMVWQAPSVPEQPMGYATADQSPAESGLEASGDRGVTGITPLATKERPATSDASPLTLFLGGFLLLCGFLVFGATRRRSVN